MRHDNQVSWLSRAVIATAARLVPADHSEDVAGDLEERWRREASASRVTALFTLVASAASIIWHLRFRRAALDQGQARAGRLAGLRQDLKYAVRSFRASPGIAAIVVLTMALGIGANTAVFSVVYAVVLKPLPYAEPHRLVVVAGTHPQREAGLHSTSLADFRDWERSARGFESMATFAYWTFNMSGGELPFRVIGGVVTGRFFSTLGTPPLLGRTLNPEDERVDGDRVVLAHAAWRRLFHSDPGVVGRVVSLNGRPTEVVGVMPASFRFPAEDVEIWAPLRNELDTVPRVTRFMMTIGKLAPGVTHAAAEQELAAIGKEMLARYPGAHRHWSFAVLDARTALVREVRQPLVLLLAASGLVLAIACANLANLLLSRASARRRECAIRVALGASRGQLLRQFLIESLLLAAAGGALGLLVARGSVAALISLQPVELPRIDEVALHPAVLAGSALAAIASGILFGLIPALHASSSTERALRESSRSISGGRAQQARRMFVIAEIALACVLVIGGLLLLRSFGRVTAIDPGFRPEGIATVRVFLGPPRYRRFTDQNAYVTRALDQVRALPGVSAVAVGTNLPLGDEITREPVVIDGRPDVPDARPRAEIRAVTPGYFSLLGISLLEGRAIAAHDTATSEPVALVNRAMARSVWPGESVVGKRLRWSAPSRDTRWMTVVGVVDDVAGSSLEEPEGPALYIPYEQRTMVFLRWATIAARTSGDAAALAETMRRSLRAVDADLPVFAAQSIESRFERAVAPRRFGLLLLGMFSGLAVLIALSGVYGVIAFAVAQRRREMSVRLALGAQPRDLFALVLGDGARLAAIGIGLGLAASWAAGKKIEGLLFGVSAHDGASYAGTAIIIALVAMMSTAVPAWRSSRIAPSEALKD